MSLWCESRAPTQTSMLGGGRLRLSDCVLTAERRDRKRAFDPRGWVLVVPTSRLEPRPTTSFRVFGLLCAGAGYRSIRFSCGPPRPFCIGPGLQLTCRVLQPRISNLAEARKTCAEPLGLPCRSRLFPFFGFRKLPLFFGRVSSPLAVPRAQARVSDPTGCGKMRSACLVPCHPFREEHFRSQAPNLEDFGRPPCPAGDGMLQKLPCLAECRINCAAASIDCLDIQLGSFKRASNRSTTLVVLRPIPCPLGSKLQRQLDEQKVASALLSGEAGSGALAEATLLQSPSVCGQHSWPRFAPGRRPGAPKRFAGKGSRPNRRQEKEFCQVRPCHSPPRKALSYELLSPSWRTPATS